MFEIRRTKKAIHLSRFRYSATARRSVRVHVVALAPDATVLPASASGWSQDERDQVSRDVLGANIEGARAIPKLAQVAAAAMAELAGSRLIVPTACEVQDALAALMPLVRALEKGPR